MKLWLISQDVNDYYDTFDSAVVAAETEEEARLIYPDAWEANIRWNGNIWLWELEDGLVIDYSPSQWTTPDNVQVKFLADNYEGEAGTVLASFNARQF